MMHIEDLRTLALSLKASTEDIKWEEHLCFCVGGKMFLITSPDRIPVDAAFKVDEEMFDELIDRDNFIQAPHFARRKWIRVEDISSLSKKEWRRLIEHSYNNVVNTLTKKLRKELGLLSE